MCDKELFWGGGGSYTHVHNRLYNAPPFGWESYNNPPDFPRCTENPYSSNELTKSIVHNTNSNHDIIEKFSINNIKNPLLLIIVIGILYIFLKY